MKEESGERSLQLSLVDIAEAQAYNPEDPREAYPRRRNRQ